MTKSKFGQLTAKHVRLLADSGDLVSGNRVPKCAKLLIANGVDDYKGLWKDVSLAIDAARDVRAEKAEKEARQLDLELNRIAKICGCSNWNSLQRMPLERLLAIDTGNWKPSRVDALGELIKNKQAAKRKRAAANLFESRLRTEKGLTRMIYCGRSAVSTRKLHRAICEHGPIGAIAAQCLRVQKASALAKAYRGDSKERSYDTKEAAIQELCRMLTADSAGLDWGWGNDSNEPYAQYVLYVELPTGQVSWHSCVRFDGPDHKRGWDLTRASESRIIQFAEDVLLAPHSEVATPP